MQIAEKVTFSDGNMTIVETYDPNPVLRRSALLRESDAAAPLAESKCLATFPTWLFHQWLREAGLKPEDPAAEDVILRKMVDPDFAHFRVWGGRL